MLAFPNKTCGITQYITGNHIPLSMKKKFIINGVDLKIELLIALSVIPSFLIFSGLSLFFYNHFTGFDFKNISFYIVLGGMIFGIVLGLVFAEYLGKKLSSKWILKYRRNSLK